MSSTATPSLRAEAVGAGQKSWLCRAAFSSIGAKVTMAVTGVLVFGFVLGHMIGNLQIYLGQDAYNSYAHFLQSKPALVWVVRIGMLGALALHALSGIRLVRLNRAARPQAYVMKKTAKTTLFAKTMPLTGLVIMTFVVYHLLHFTAGVTHPELHALVDAQGRHDVYSAFVASFQDPLVAGAYIVAMVLLGFHLAHGVSSLFQTLGINHPRYNPIIRLIGPAFGALVVIGNASMPIAVLLGFITLPSGVAL